MHEAQESLVSHEEELSLLQAEYDRCREIDSELQKEVERLNAELVRVDEEHKGRVEWLQMEAELQHYCSLEEQRRNWELKESQLRELLRAAHDRGYQIELLSSHGESDTLSLELRLAVISSYICRTRRE